ncbi:transposable element Tcb1 transposase [Trichonephila clavipes]|nr:transposable element Tcb1 transposase [Trichonephila clavipes]
MFSDESRFSLQSDSRRILIWRAPGTRYHQANTIERYRYGGAGWLVWGGIILGSRIDLHVQSDWPVYSPDLNPIEHMWDMLARRIAACQPTSTCLPELRRALLDEWCNIPQDQIDNLMLGMPRHCKACIASSGRHTPY